MSAVVGCYFPRDPRSPSMAAKAHGRVGVVMRILQLILSMAYTLNDIVGLQVRLVCTPQ
jgi:hypothetical protein